MDIRKQILDLAKKSKSKIILPESFDIRILKAAQKLTEESIAKIVLPSDNPENVKKLAFENGISLDGTEIIKIDRELLDKNEVETFVEARGRKGLIEEDALKLLKKPIYFSAMYLKSGKCDVCVGGAVYDTAEVLRASIQIVGTAEGIKMVSSYFLMVPPKDHPLIKEPILFADCAVNPEPQSLGLKDIAIAAVGNFRKLFLNRTANVSMLSFSTKGSAQNKVLDKVIEAVELVKKHFDGQKDVNIDGELQFDTSIVSAVGKRKAPNSSVAGQANILIFPDLNAGNIGYKIAERFGGFQALGPIIQGLSLPVSDLSRGASVDDICMVGAIMALK
jgi:phosphate acetyltransferase